MKRKRSCGSFELERRKNKFFEDLQNEDMTLDKMKEISVNNHYSTSMIVDMLFRDYTSIVIESKWEKDEIKNTYAVKKGYGVEVIWEFDIRQEGFLDEYVSKFC